MLAALYHKRAQPAPHLQHMARREQADPLAQRGAAHAQPRGQLNLPRQAIAGRKLLLNGDEGQNLLGGFLRQAVFLLLHARTFSFLMLGLFQNEKRDRRDAARTQAIPLSDRLI